MGHKTQKKSGSADSYRRVSFSIVVTIVCLTSLGTLFLNTGIKGVEEIVFPTKTLGYDDYGSDNGDGAYDPHDPSAREEMMNDIDSQRRGNPNEASTKKKTFKLFEKRRLNHEKAKAFCKKREGQLAQAMNIEEMQRIQTLLMKGTTLSTSVWIGADKKEWKKHSSKMLGLRPNLPANAMMMGGGPTNMCPSMSMSTRSLAPVECYKEFAFICEFPPGKGKPPPTPKTSLKAGLKKGKKKTRKEEMRRKREILRLYATSTDNDTSTLSYFSESTIDILKHSQPSEENVLEEGTTESNVAEEQSATEFERNHRINFHPHIEFSSKMNSDENGNSSNRPDDEMDLERVSTVTAPTDHLRSKDLGVGNESLSLDNDVNDFAEMKETTTDPDQQLLNEFDEQLENMKLIDPVISAENVSITSNSGGQDLEFSTKQVNDHEANDRRQANSDIQGGPLGAVTRQGEFESSISMGDSKITWTNENPTNPNIYVVQNRSAGQFPGAGTTPEINFDGPTVPNRLVAA